ncbi:hypothetical protein SLEP1_g23171 [Rubroshorea leprosula]|uniref:Uncharacterized protein n=1 Tax=Rubroshorea leprosula TaxID=152421 RepID=A0AAV5JL26_9ROSI|nr:hypothetical protein SLEP1_g23171 [Rubroshorea leprosula]
MEVERPFPSLRLQNSESQSQPPLKMKLARRSSSPSETPKDSRPPLQTLSTLALPLLFKESSNHASYLWIVTESEIR